MKTLTKAIIVDLDGTLCNVDHRLHFVRDKRKNWNKFFLELVNDPINVWCHEIIKRFSDYQILLVSGRPEDHRDITEQWLEEKGIEYKSLHMRKTGDFRKDDIVKTEIYNSFIKDNYDVLFTIDDRKQVVDMWRSLGLVCLQCAEGNF